MKKRIRIVIFALLLVVCSASLCACGIFDNGDGNMAKAAVVATVAEEHDNYTVYDLTADGKHVGVRIAGTFFGISARDLYVDIYYDGAGWKDELTSAEKEAKENLQAAVNEIVLAANTVNELCNTLLDGSGGNSPSDVWRYNNAEPGARLEINYHTYKMLSLAKQMYAETDGRFNPALFRAVDLWGFSARFTDGIYKRYAQNYDRTFDYANNSYPLPGDKFVAAFADKDFVRFDDVTEEVDGKFFVTKSAAAVTVDGVMYSRWIDLGGIAKGYVCDLIEQTLANKNLKKYYASVGDSSAVCGSDYDGEQFDLAVVNPFSPSTAACSVYVSGGGVSSSGLYNRNYTVEGKVYAHIIDGANGRPTTSGVYGVTMITGCSQAAVADCLTTAISQMTVGQITDFINGYAAQNDITVLAFVRTVDGKKQLLTNCDYLRPSKGGGNDITNALKKVDGKYVYDESATSDAEQQQNAKTVTIAVLCTTFAILIAVTVVLCVVNRRKKQNVVYKEQTAFCRADIYVYFAVATLVVLLFVACARPVGQVAATVKAVDMESGKTLFAYDIANGKWQTFDEGGITCEVIQNGQSLTVTVNRGTDGKYNTFEIVPASNGVNVTMKAAECGVHKDCIRVFGTISAGSIVCSPNMLKVIVQ